MKFKIKADDLEKIVDWKESKLLIQEFQEDLTQDGTIAELSLINDDGEEFWKSPIHIDKNSSSDVRTIISKSFDNHGVPASDRDAWLDEFDKEIQNLPPILEKEVDVAEPVEQVESVEPPTSSSNQPQNAHATFEEAIKEPIPKKEKVQEKADEKADNWGSIEEPTKKSKKEKKFKKSKKSDQGELVESIPTASKQASFTGKEVVRVIGTWKVAVLVLVVTLVYFTALTLIFQYLNVTNEFVLVGVPLASSFVLIWYIGSLVSSAKRKVLEDGITKEVSIYVAQEQLKQKRVLEQKLENLNNLYGSNDEAKLITAESFENAMRLAKETVENDE